MAGIAFAGRLSEEFKLASGTWVRATTLRTQLIDALQPYVRDLVIAAPDRPYLGALVWLDATACAEAGGAAVWRPALARLLAAFNGRPGRLEQPHPAAPRRSTSRRPSPPARSPTSARSTRGACSNAARPTSPGSMPSPSIRVIADICFLLTVFRPRLANALQRWSAAKSALREEFVDGLRPTKLKWTRYGAEHTGRTADLRADAAAADRRPSRPSHHEWRLSARQPPEGRGIRRGLCREPRARARGVPHPRAAWLRRDRAAPRRARARCSIRPTSPRCSASAPCCSAWPHARPPSGRSPELIKPARRTGRAALPLGRDHGHQPARACRHRRRQPST